MAIKLENQDAKKLSGLKWLMVGILISGGLIANYYYSYQPWPYRLLGWLALLAAAGALASQTNYGHVFINFARDSRMELRKVVWPTRQETVQTTLIIAVMVVVLALLLWGIDGVLVWLIGWLTGQRG
jgi:preprotein translocase subunit SecE